ncbi:MAG: hypothetical protein WC873_04225 [Candidatus Gracilibacteria bacterium]
MAEGVKQLPENRHVRGDDADLFYFVDDTRSESDTWGEYDKERYFGKVEYGVFRLLESALSRKEDFSRLLSTASDEPRYMVARCQDLFNQPEYERLRFFVRKGDLKLISSFLEPIVRAAVWKFLAQASLGMLDPNGISSEIPSPLKNMPVDIVEVFVNGICGCIALWSQKAGDQSDTMRNRFNNEIASLTADQSAEGEE